jgi:L-alanine-DL-glutamate epimerase-like enolase superfamily enzyme
MRIAKVEPILLTAANDSQEVVGLRSVSLIEITTDEGLTGLGETYAGFYVPELVLPIVEHYAPLLLGQDPLQIPALMTELNHKSRRWGRHGIPQVVLSGIECALWDLKGKALGQPVYELLGGLAHPRLRTYHSMGPAYWPIERTLAEVEAALERGYTAVKFATGFLGRSPARTISEFMHQEGEKLEALRANFGHAIDLAIDHHAGFHRRPLTANEAIRLVAALDEYHLLWFEEPCDPERPEEYAAVCRAVRTPIAGGENASTVPEFGRFLGQQALDIAQPDACWIGGIGPCREVLDACRVANIPVAMHVGSVATALAANLHLALATPGCFVVEYWNENPLCRELWIEPPAFKDGYVYPPAAPGLGIQLTTEARIKYAFVPGSGIAHPSSTWPRA